MAYDYKGQVISRGNGNKRATLALQQMLKDAGYSPGKIDGAFGPSTEAALRKFQVNNGLDPDMIAGQETWRQLERSAPQPMDNPRRNLARGLPDEIAPAEPIAPMGETAPAPMGETAPANLAGQMASAPGPDPNANLPQGQVGGAQMVTMPPGQDLSAFVKPQGAPAVQPMQPGMGPGPESSSGPPPDVRSALGSSDPQEDPAVAQAMQALATQRGRQFIAEALAQRAGGGQGRPSPFAALGGGPPAGAFVSPGAPDIPSTVGMPPWLADRMGQR